jgi:hypothetical protein
LISLILAVQTIGIGLKLLVFGLPAPGLVPPLPVVPAGLVVELVGAVELLPLEPAAPAVKREAEEDWGAKTMAMIEVGHDVLILKRASTSRSSGQWSDDDFDVLANGVVGRSHLQGKCRTRRKPLDVDAGFRPPQGSRADTRLCCDTRGRDGGLCAMCGRLRVGKENLTWQAWVGAAMCSAFECGSHDRWP